MNLHTDEQTIEDLRIFGKREVAGMYDIYNHAHTRGGEVRLREMFSVPLSDRALIQQRSEIFRHFAGINLSFPFAAADFDIIEKYLSYGNGTTQHNNNAALGEKEIKNAVVAVITLLQQAKVFLESPVVVAIAPYASERAVIASLLTIAALAPALQETHVQKLSFGAVTAYDQLFRIRERQTIIQLLQQLYMLDVYMTVGQVAVKNNFVFARALEKGPFQLKLEGVWHPALKQPVSNDITVTGERNVLFLTGANMAGKSTFLRALSTAVYIAHMGFPVAATAMEFTVLDGIYTTINLPDNLGIGASHFYVEVLRVKKVAEELHSGKSLLVIFDELFRGTNVKDAHEATVSVIGAFTKKQQSMFVISSHIVEVGDDLHDHPSVDFRYLPTRMNGHTPEYTYKLERGVTDDRHGMVIIRNEGILDILKNGRKPAKSAGRKSIIGNKQLQQP